MNDDNGLEIDRQQELDKEWVLIRELIKRLPEEEKVEAGVWLCTNIATFAGTSRVEMIGILEQAKEDMFMFMMRVECEMEDENETQIGD